MKQFSNFTWYLGAKYERIAGVALNARTSGYVVNDRAFSVLTAGAWARVYTLVSNARLISRTVGVENTFGSTSSVRIALILRQTGADAVVALSVCAAR
mgnify:CR=1